MQPESRKLLLRETYELSHEIGFRHFLAENFHRSDAVLMRPEPEARKAFLREWWDAAKERMYERYARDIAGQWSDDELLQQWHLLKEATDRLPANDNRYHQGQATDQPPARGNEPGCEHRLHELRHELTGHTTQCDLSPEHSH